MNSIEIINEALKNTGLEAVFPYEHKMLFAVIMDQTMRMGWNNCLDEIEKRGGNIEGVERKEIMPMKPEK